MAVWLLLAVAGLGVGCNNYDDHIDSLNDRVDQLAKNQVASAQSQVKALEQTAAKLNQANDALASRIDNLKKQQESVAHMIDELNKSLGGELAAHQNAIEAQIKQLEQLDAALKNHVEAYEAAKAELEGRLNQLETRLEDYATNADLNAMAEDIALWKQIVADTYATLDQIAALDGRVASLELQAQELAKTVAEVCNVLADLDKRLSADLANVAANLKNAIDDFKSQIDELAARMEQDKQDLTAAIATAKDEAIKAAGEACEAAFQGRFDAAFVLAFGDAFSGAFGDAFDEAFAPAFDAAFKAAFGEAFAREWAPIRDKMSKDFAAYDEALRTAVADAITKEHGKITEEIAAAIKTAIDKLEPRVKAVEEKLATLEGRVDKLEQNIHSMTWIPTSFWNLNSKEVLFRGADYVRDPETGDMFIINNLVDPNMHNTVLKYHIEPAALAKKITAENISFLVAELTRSTMPEFTVTELSATDEGDLTIRLYTDYVFSGKEAESRVFAMAVKVDMDPANPASINTFVTDYVPVSVQGGEDVTSNIVCTEFTKDGTLTNYSQKKYSLSAKDMETSINLFNGMMIHAFEPSVGEFLPLNEIWGDQISWGITGLESQFPAEMELTEPTPETLYPSVKAKQDLTMYIGYKWYYKASIYLRYVEPTTQKEIRIPVNTYTEQVNIVGYDLPLAVDAPITINANLKSWLKFSITAKGEMVHSDLFSAFDQYTFTGGIDFNPDMWGAYGSELTKEDGTVISNDSYFLGMSLGEVPADPYTQINLDMNLNLNDMRFSEPGVYTLKVVFRHTDLTWTTIPIRIEVGEALPLEMDVAVSAGDYNGENSDVIGNIYLSCLSHSVSQLGIACLPKTQVEEWIAAHPEDATPYDTLIATYGEMYDENSAEINEINQFNHVQRLMFSALSPSTEYQVVLMYNSIKGEHVIEHKFFTTTTAVERAPLTVEMTVAPGDNPACDVVVNVKSPSKTAYTVFMMISGAVEWDELIQAGNSEEELIDTYGNDFPWLVEEINSDQGAEFNLSYLSPNTEYVIGAKVTDAMGVSVIRLQRVTTAEQVSNQFEAEIYYSSSSSMYYMDCLSPSKDVVGVGCLLLTPDDFAQLLSMGSLSDIYQWYQSSAVVFDIDWVNRINADGVTLSLGTQACALFRVEFFDGTISYYTAEPPATAAVQTASVRSAKAPMAKELTLVAKEHAVRSEGSFEFKHVLRMMPAKISVSKIEM